MNVEDIASQNVSVSRHSMQHDWKDSYRDSYSCFPR